MSRDEVFPIINLRTISKRKQRPTSLVFLFVKYFLRDWHDTSISDNYSQRFLEKGELIPRINKSVNSLQNEGKENLFSLCIFGLFRTRPHESLHFKTVPKILRKYEVFSMINQEINCRERKDNVVPI